MEHLQLTRDGPVAVLAMARGKANALNAAMVDELLAAVAQLERDAAVRALVLASDRPRFFSSGLDVLEVFAYDRPRLTEFFGRFMELYESLARLSKPVIAAVSGHAYAGGAILALACDFRVMAEGGQFDFALNEVNLGVVLPPGVLRLLVQALGPPAAREVLLTGNALTPERALECGLAFGLCPADAVRERALTLARALADKPAAAFAAAKRGLRSAFASNLPDLARYGLDDFVDHWFAPDCVARRVALVGELAKRQ